MQRQFLLHLRVVQVARTTVYCSLAGIENIHHPTSYSLSTVEALAYHTCKTYAYIQINTVRTVVINVPTTYLFQPRIFYNKYNTVLMFVNVLISSSQCTDKAMRA